MGLLTTEINELRQLLSDFDGNKLSPEDLHAKLQIYSQTEKRSRLILSAWSIAVRNGVKAFDRDVVKGLISGGKIKNIKKLADRTAERGT